MNVLRPFYQLCPFRMAPWEATGMRLLFALVIFDRLPLRIPPDSPFRGLPAWLPPGGFVPFDTQPVPNGIAQWFDLTALSNPDWQPLLWTVSLLALAAYVAGRGLILALPLLTGLLWASGTLNNSQGYIGHSGQLLVLILLMQTVVVWFHPLARWMNREPVHEGHSRTGDAMFYYSIVALVAVYMTAGISKLAESNGRWVRDSHYVAIYVIKTQRQKFHNELDEAYAAERVPYATAMLEHPNLTRAAMAGGLFLELFCFVALLGRPWAVVTGLAIIGFHVTCGLVMHLPFVLNQKIAFVLLVNPAFLAGSAWLFVRHRLRPSPSSR